MSHYEMGKALEGDKGIPVTACARWNRRAGSSSTAHQVAGPPISPSRRKGSKAAEI